MGLLSYMQSVVDPNVIFTIFSLMTRLYAQKRIPLVATPAIISNTMAVPAELEMTRTVHPGSQGIVSAAREPPKGFTRLQPEARTVPVTCCVIDSSKMPAVTLALCSNEAQGSGDGQVFNLQGQIPGDKAFQANWP